MALAFLCWFGRVVCIVDDYQMEFLRKILIMLFSEEVTINKLLIIYTICKH